MKKSIAANTKRGAVGALILAALSTGDKYGWEIMKAIEKESGGEYILKEPSLYSALRRLKESGHVNSYWQDSDIGGRRHYYSLTQKGLVKLRDSDIEWSEKKDFVNNLFDATKLENLSEVDSSIKNITNTVQEVRQVVNKLQEKEEQFEQILKIDQPTSKEELATIEPALSDTSPIKNLEKKNMGGIILPTINPLQQDLFSLSIPQETGKENIKDIDTLEQTHTQEQVNLEKTLPIDELFPIEESEEIKDSSALFLKEEDATKELEFLEGLEKEGQKEEGLFIDAHAKPQKYTSTPKPFVQVPMFEEANNFNISTFSKDEVEIKPSTQKAVLPHIKSLASEKDFNDIRQTLSHTSAKSFFASERQTSKNFDNPYTPGQFNNSNTLYGSFDLNVEEIYNNEKESNLGFDNLGLEEDGAPKSTLSPKEDIDAFKKTKEVEPPTPSQEELQEDISAAFLPSSSKISPPAPVVEEVDNIDYKAIMGDLFVDSDLEEEDTYNKAKEDSAKELPRLNVFDNVNISLRAKRKQEEQSIYSKPTYQAPVYKTPYELEEVYQEEEKNIFTPKSLASSQVNAPKLIKHFTLNPVNDEYTNDLLEETYLKDIVVRVHKKEIKAPLLTTNYVSINKLNLSHYLTLFIFMLIQLATTYIALFNAGHINSKNNLIFLGALAICILPLVYFGVIYLFSPSKKKEVQYNMSSALINNTIMLLIVLVFIYAINLFLGMNTLNTLDFIASWLVPAVIAFNLIISPIIRFILLRRKSYYN